MANAKGSVGNSPLPPEESTAEVKVIQRFSSVSQEEDKRIILGSPTKFSELDPVPTFLIKEVIDALLGPITAIVNALLKQEYLPVFQKISIISPKLKKRNLDASVMSNWRPISNLSFLSKIIEN